MKHVYLISLLFNFYFLSSQVNLSSSLTACYSLNGHANEPINSLNGTLSAVSAVADRFANPGSALAFSGSSSSIVRLPNSSVLKSSPAISVSGWYNVTSFTDFATVVFAKNKFSTHHTAFNLAVQQNGTGYTFAIWRQDGGNSEYAEGKTNISLNTWYHVVFSLDSSATQIYINGQLEKTISNTIHSFKYDTTGVILGGTNESFNIPYTGNIDNLRFYSRIINSSEVAALYTQDPTCQGVPATPVASFSVFPSAICEGESVTLTDLSSNNPTSWTWSAPGGISQNSTASSPTFTFNTPGTYIISLTAANGGGPSANTATQAVVVHPKPGVSASASNTDACFGDVIQLFATGASNYVWSTQHTIPSFTLAPSLSAQYTVTGTDVNGCVNSATTSVTIHANPKVTAIATKTLACENESLVLTAGGAASYLWNNNKATPSITVVVNSTTTYTVNGVDMYGCKNSATVQVALNINCDGVGLAELSGNVSFYPNPVTSVFNISTDMATEYTIAVYTIEGKCLLNEKRTGSSKSVDMSAIAPGVYFLTVSSGEQSKTLKVIKQ